MSINTMTETSCCVCGIVFHVPLSWLLKRQETGASMYCPNGHSLCYKQTALETERQLTAKLQSQLNQERQAVLAAQANVRKMELKMKRQMKRVSNGVCPCCNRTFQDLQRHMASKHAGMIAGADQKRIGGASTEVVQ